MFSLAARQPALAGVLEMNHDLIVFGHSHICLGRSRGQKLSCMNNCKGDLSLLRSTLSAAERKVRFVPVQKDGLSSRAAVQGWEASLAQQFGAEEE